MSRITKAEIVKGTAEKPKLAQQIAERISRDIVKAGWPVGTVIGTEPELIERYHMSRAVLREAVRILERQGVVKMRSGPGGGLTVSSASVLAVSQTLTAYLEHSNVTFPEILAARSVLESLAVKLSVEKITRDEIRELHQSMFRLEEQSKGHELAVESHQIIRRQIGRSTKNPALELFLETLNRATVDFLYFSQLARRGGRKPNDLLNARKEFSTREVQYKRSIVDSIIMGDVERAKKFIQADLEHHLKKARTLSEDYVSSGVVADQIKEGRKARLERYLEECAGEMVKLPDVLARTILAEIRLMGWPVGERLGAELELIQSFGVSRAAFREAVRVLERDSIVHTKRGPGGGLFVDSPSPENVVNATAQYLVSMKLDVEHYASIRIAVEGQAAELVARNIHDIDSDVLRQQQRELASASPGNFVSTAIRLNILIGQLSNNRVLELLIRILVTMTARSLLWPNGSKRSTLKEQQSALSLVQQTHARIVDAMLSGDERGARKAVEYHIQQTLAYFQSLTGRTRAGSKSSKSPARKTKRAT